MREFRELLKQVGSGTHTSQSLTREQAKQATVMMLQQEATPAQIGAFMIAHRIKRPTPTELAGMLDAYDELGPHLNLDKLENTPVVLGNPYDGRSRTAPVTPITALMLAAVGVPTIMHGGDTMPTKYGIPLVEIWQGLGVDFTKLSLAQTQKCLEAGIGFVYTPNHFAIANKLVPYRDQIGKRPPFATLELIWNPTASNQVHLVAGFVHPPTETRFLETFKLRDINRFTTVKGLEGSCDLALSRTAIIGMGNPHQSELERLHLNSRDYDLGTHDIPLESLDQLIQQLQMVLQGKPSDLTDAAIYNGGFYLWRCGICADVEKGFELAKTMLIEGKVKAKLQHLAQSTQ